MEVFKTLTIAFLFFHGGFCKKYKSTCTGTKKGETINIDLKVGDVYTLTSPNYPSKYPGEEFDCKWEINVPMDASGAVVINCDQLEIGAAKVAEDDCQGDTIWLTNFQTFDFKSLCGKYDNFRVRLPGVYQKLDFEFFSGKGESHPGFSCKVKIGKSDFELGKYEDWDKPCECGMANKANETDRIINGEEAIPNEFPWMAALVEKGGHTPFCGGAIISTKHVITAGHCTVKDDVEDIEVLVGEHDLLRAGDQSMRYRLKRVIEHPNLAMYRRGYRDTDWDYAILVLRERLRFSKFVRPICLPVLSNEMMKHDFEGALAKVSGFGDRTTGETLDTGLGDQATNLQKITDLKVISNKDCQSFYNKWHKKHLSYNFYLQKTMICSMTGKDKKTPCFGDSGSAMMLETDKAGQHVLIGLVAFGAECGHPEVPAVYARVTTVLPWIWSIVEDENLCLPPGVVLNAEEKLKRST